jgi:hypothetical protein
VLPRAHQWRRSLHSHAPPPALPVRLSNAPTLTSAVVW